MSAKDLYIQNMTVSEYDSHSDSFQVKLPNVFTNYPLGEVRVEDRKLKDWDHYKFTLWQTQMNFAVFCASSACGVSVEHMNAKKSMIRSVYRFHVYYHIRRILRILEISMPYENTFNQYNNPYNHEMFIKVCGEYGVSNDLTKWRNQKYFSTWQSRAWETGKPGRESGNLGPHLGPQDPRTFFLSCRFAILFTCFHRFRYCCLLFLKPINLLI